MIELGLSRISRLVQQKSLSWKAIHVAGTNGKGSIVGYVSTLLTAGGVRCGAFTSPHLIDRWDCITINERVVQEPLFRRIEAEVKRRNTNLNIGATEFELLTATAFEIFHHEKVEVGVVEVGMGGRLDATNILTNVLVSVIAKIGLDHQAMLGNTLREIAWEKAGIMKPGSLCVIDGTNAPEVKQVIEAKAEETKTPTLFTNLPDINTQFPNLGRTFDALGLVPHERTNVSCAIMALREVLSKIRPDTKVDDSFRYISHNPRSGRLQFIDLSSLVDRKERALLDGAHNPQSAEVLSSYVDQNLRQPKVNVTWVIAASQGKDLEQLFANMIKPGDNVAVVKFGPVDGMPWVRSVSTSELLKMTRNIPAVGKTEGFGEDIARGLDWANSVSRGQPLIIAGSLYLVSDILRLLRKAEQDSVAIQRIGHQSHG